MKMLLGKNFIQHVEFIVQSGTKIMKEKYVEWPVFIPCNRMRFYLGTANIYLKSENKVAFPQQKKKKNDFNET